MKRLLFVLLVLGISVPASADVFVYAVMEKQSSINYDNDEWQKSSDTEAGYLVAEPNGDKINIWHVETSKQKDDKGKTQTYVEYSGEPQELGFVEAQTGKKILWIITFADENDRGLLIGEAKPTKIGAEKPTVAASFTGLSIWDQTDEDDGDRYTGIGNISMRLDTKMTAEVWGLNGNQAVQKIIEIKGYIDCKANPCLCNGEWKFEPSMNIARDQFAGGVIDGKIYVFGGNSNPNQVNLKSTETYDPIAQVWTLKANNEHNGGWGVEELTAAAVNGKLYVFGAWGGDGVINFNEMYDPVYNSWTTLAQKPTTVAAAPSTVYNNEIYLFGGYYMSDSDSEQIRYKVVECYNPSSNTWRYVTDLPLSMSNFAVAVIGTKAYLFGGATGTEPDYQFRDDVITYDFETGIWATSGYKPLQGKMAFVYSGAAPVIDGKIYLIGGWGLDTKGKFVSNKSVDIYNPATNSWEKGPPLPLPWDAFVSVVIDKKIYVIGGFHEPSSANRAKAEVVSFDTQSCSP